MKAYEKLITMIRTHKSGMQFVEIFFEPKTNQLKTSSYISVVVNIFESTSNSYCWILFDLLRVATFISENDRVNRRGAKNHGEKDSIWYIFWSSKHTLECHNYEEPQKSYSEPTLSKKK